jgi:hypothetical protein
VFSIFGADEFSNELRDLSRNASRDADQATEKTLEEIASTARRLGTERWHKRPQISVGTIETNASSKYVELTGVGGFFQEIGTSHHPPKPVMGPAVDAHMPGYYRRLYEVLGGE